MTGTWIRAASLALALIVVPCGAAAAEDDPLAPPPAEEGAPPAPSGKEEAKKPELPKVPAGDAAKPTPVEEKAPVEKADAWGTPDASPTKDVSTDLLPPPVVRNPATGTSTGGSARTTSPIATTPPLGTPDTFRPVESDFIDVDPALIPLNPAVAPKTPAPGTGTGTLKAAAPAGARIRTIAKVHNVRLRDGSSALRLDVEFGASGQQSQSLLLAAGFSRGDTGRTIRSLVPAYAGRAGNVVARTAPVRIQADGIYRASLWVPYGAFPAPPAGSSYNVRALVQLLRQGARGAETVMSHQTTTFTVHGPTAR